MKVNTAIETKYEHSSYFKIVVESVRTASRQNKWQQLERNHVQRIERII